MTVITEDPSSILSLLPGGAAATAVIVVVVVFLKEIRTMRKDVAVERAEERADFKRALDRIAVAHERATKQIADRVELVAVRATETRESVDELRRRFETHVTQRTGETD
jgi:hypothetical protein